jgi:hypothetical protein
MLTIEPTDTVLITGIRKMGKTHLVRAFLEPHLKEQGAKVRYHRTPTCIKSLEAGCHHIIDDFDKVPMRQITPLLDAIQAISMAGRHNATGLTIIVHHPTWTSKEFRLTPDHLIAFRTPSDAGTKWMRPFLGRHHALVAQLPRTWAFYSGEIGRWLVRLEPAGKGWYLRGVSPDQPPFPVQDM